MEHITETDKEVNAFHVSLIKRLEVERGLSHHEATANVLSAVTASAQTLKHRLDAMRSQEEERRKQAERVKNKTPDWRR